MVSVTADSQASEQRPSGGAKQRRWLVTVAQLLLAAFVLGAAELAVASGAISTLVMPRPSEVAKYLLEDVQSILTGGYVLYHYSGTLIAIVIGFAGALIGGVVVGAVLSEWQPARRLVYPYVVALYSTPRIAIAPLILVWFGFGLLGKIVLGASIAIFPILVSTVAGLQATDAHTLRFAHALGATRWESFYKIRLPMALPYIFAGLSSAAVLAAVGAVVGEFTGGARGLGYLILVSQQNLELAQVFAFLVILAINGYALFLLVGWLRRRIVFWAPTEDFLDR